MPVTGKNGNRSKIIVGTVWGSQDEGLQGFWTGTRTCDQRDRVVGDSDEQFRCRRDEEGAVVSDKRP